MSVIIASNAAPTVSLDAFAQELRAYQAALVNKACAFVDGLDPKAQPTARRRLYSLPTGTGKGTVQLALLQALRSEAEMECPECKGAGGDKRLACTECNGEGVLVFAGLDAWIYTPSLDVMRGYLERCGVPADVLDEASEQKIAEMGEAICVTTPTRAQNRILAGERGVPEVVLYDEVHHATEENDVSGTLFALAPLTAWIGFTATPYRGTPKGTADLEAAWPVREAVLTIPDAVAGGYWALPRFEVVGLVDDDEVKVAGGNFVEKAAAALVGSRIEDLAELIAKRAEGDVEAAARESCICGLAPFQTFDASTCRCVAFARFASGEFEAPILPTAVTVPSTETAGLLVEALDRKGVPARRVGADTPAGARALAYAEAREGKGVLVSVRVLSEGVDFPWLRRLVDARPTLSPVSWLQQIGRITRPGPVQPEYICVCRNLERHAYLLQGMVPRTTLAAAQDAFPAPSKRGGGRAIGLEALSKFKAIDLPLADGVRGTMFAVYQTAPDGVITEWVALLDPTSERSITARRTVGPVPADASTKRTYGKWERAPLPDDLAGHATSGFRGEVSDKQKAWWEREATKRGLDVAAVRGTAKLAQRQFAALPVLRDLGLSMRAETIA